MRKEVEYEIDEIIEERNQVTQQKVSTGCIKKVDNVENDSQPRDAA